MYGIADMYMYIRTYAYKPDTYISTAMVGMVRVINLLLAWKNFIIAGYMVAMHHGVHEDACMCRRHILTAYE